MNRHMSSDELNEQIRESLQVRESPEQLTRLDAFWRRRSRADRRGRLIRRTAALAATVLAVASLSIFFRDDEGGPDSLPIRVAERQEVSREPLVPNGTPIVELSEPPAVASQPDETALSSAGRTPTAYEQLVFAIHAGGPISPQRPPAMAAIEPPANRLARDRAAEEGKQRDETLKAVDQMTDVGQLAQLARETRDRHIRQAVFHRLVRFDSETAARAYLALAADETFRDEALAAADAAGPSFVDVLLNLLDDKDKAVRRVSALVLGHKNGPEVTQSLIARVQDDPDRSTETWMALVACRGQAAKEFFAIAMSSPRMLGRFNCARLEWARMIP
jgi:hypothetical protein